MIWIDAIGWTAAVVLLATIGPAGLHRIRRDKTSKLVYRDGCSSGQCAASSLFVIYSWLLSNWVFVITNLMLLVTALIGHAVYRRNLPEILALRLTLAEGGGPKHRDTLSTKDPPVASLGPDFQDLILTRFSSTGRSRVA